ncbi:glycosyltransferase family 1 protein [Tychonema sp. BBK16]|uniref:glycosyltransferase family 1 protein n=1 Tax=Tychonema sp. BBK16 TaxID=2699888 RepID=UPI001F3F80AB|nr:glycosyltransferase family 1 protein [Tychonema sp. BBK16]MCF6372672.1 glycosyltransferase family 1 protein [Tychonema sp. BBK16]
MASVNGQTIRILHVVGGMNRGGIETWLMHVLRHIDRDRFQMDFLVHTTEPCPYDDEVRALGSKIIPCLDPSKPLLYARNFKRILGEYGPYDIVHSHVHHFSGYVLYLAKQAGVAVRIAHSHNDTSVIDAKAGLHRRLYLTLTKWLIDRYAKLGLSASRQVRTVLFNQAWKTDSRWQILYCGVDLIPFRDIVDSVAVRAEFGIPADAFVVGHVGRFEEQKNHLFLLEVAAAIAQKQPNMRLLLVSDGSLRPQIKQKSIEMGLDKYVIFAGLRSDVPRLMLGAMDTFVLPSLYEGLGLVLIEAQAAGLPCVFSNVVPEEADVIKPLLQRISLAQTASEWSNAILTTNKAKPKITQAEAYKLIEQSSFNIHNSVKQLEELYTGEIIQ